MILFYLCLSKSELCSLFYSMKTLLKYCLLKLGNMYFLVLHFVGASNNCTYWRFNAFVKKGCTFITDTHAPKLALVTLDDLFISHYSLTRYLKMVLIFACFLSFSTLVHFIFDILLFLIFSTSSCQKLLFLFMCMYINSIWKVTLEHLWLM